MEYADTAFFISHGFTEDRWSFQMGDFSFMKTTLKIRFEVVYKHKIIRQIPATQDAVKEIYKELSGNDLTPKHNSYE